MSDAIEDRHRPHLPEPRKHFLERQDIFEEFQILFEDRARLIKHNQHEAGFADEGIRLHFAEVFNDFLTPLRTVAAVGMTTFAKLIGDFDFEPEGIRRRTIARLGWIKERLLGGYFGLKWSVYGRKDKVAPRTMR